MLRMESAQGISQAALGYARKVRAVPIV